MVSRPLRAEVELFQGVDCREELTGHDALTVAVVMGKDTQLSCVLLIKQKYAECLLLKSYPVLDAFCMPATVLQHFCVFFI